MTKIMLDPGHGGRDPGANANGLQEKELTLDISLRIRRIIENEYDGVHVRLTRDQDIFIGLSERADMANAWGADFFLSVHINAGGGEGFESYVYTAASERSVAYQNMIHPEIARATGRADRGKKQANFAVLRETNMPALLTENLFIDYVADAQLLKDPAMLDAIARGHVNGLEKAFGLKRKQQGVGPFPDVPTSHWAAEAIQRMKDAGIMSGYEDGTFRPDQPVTRAELAVVVDRWYNKKGL